jgi:DtxR family Mn-dependent transcriptional regulator
MISESMDEYIEALLKFEHEGLQATVKTLAQRLTITPPSASGMVRKLVAKGFVTQGGKKGIVLTETGRERALKIIRKHRLAERFLVDVLGLPWDDVHDDACKFEHILSDRVADALEMFLKNPEYCPHGHPIPNKQGVIRKEDYIRLSELRSDDSGEVVKVAENSQELLRYLSALGLIPGTKFHIEQVAPFNGAFLVKIKDSCYALGKEIAEKIWVRKKAGHAV